MLIIALVVLAAVMIAFMAVFVTDLVKSHKDNKRKYHKSEVIMAFAFLLPACVMMFFFVILPIFMSLGYSFTNYDLMRPDDIGIAGDGFDNFRQLWKELKEHQPIYNALINTTVFVLLVVPVQIGLALLLALFVNNKRRGTTVFKVCFFAPVAISLSVTAYLWKQIIPSGALKTDFVAMLWIVLLSAWQGCGFQMLIFLSALGNIRKDLYEAARVDGANVFQRFWTVTVPGLKPTMLYILITVFIGACRVMIQPMLLTGYQTQTVTISYFMYKQGFDYWHVGYSCAIALVMTIFMGTITFLQRKLLGEKKK